MVQRYPVLFDGKRLCLISSTKPELQVDMWLANHPFYNKSQIMVDAKVELRIYEKYRLDTTEQ
jgi:ribosomal protein L31